MKGLVSKPGLIPLFIQCLNATTATFYERHDDGGCLCSKKQVVKKAAKRH